MQYSHPLPPMPLIVADGTYTIHPSIQGSLVFWLPPPQAIPFVAVSSGFPPSPLPSSCSPNTLSFIHFLFSASHPLALFLPKFGHRGRCVALEQALLIEHLFRHGAGSVACGRAAGGWSRGRHYVILHILRCLVHLY